MCVTRALLPFVIKALSHECRISLRVHAMRNECHFLASVDIRSVSCPFDPLNGSLGNVRVFFVRVIFLLCQRH